MKHPSTTSARLYRESKRKVITRRTDEPGSKFERLVEIIKTLRSPEGCPWDREQTLKSLRAFLLEETYEVIEAIDKNDHVSLEEEIGDLFFEAIFLIQICTEHNYFTITDTLDAICIKLIRRHPHVFNPSSNRLTSSEQVLKQWGKIKQKERKDHDKHKTLLSGISPILPALLRAYEIGSRAASVNFDWNSECAVVDKIQEETTELQEAIREGNPENVEEEIGDLLFSIANLSRKLGIEPETALRLANNKFTRRFNELEKSITKKGRSIHDTSQKEMEAGWKKIKRQIQPLDQKVKTKTKTR